MTDRIRLLRIFSIQVGGYAMNKNEYKPLQGKAAVVAGATRGLAVPLR